MLCSFCGRRIPFIFLLLLLNVTHPIPYTLTPPHLSVPDADVISSSGQTWPSLVASAMISGQPCFGPYLSRATTTAGVSSCALLASATLRRVPSSSGHAMTCCQAFLATLLSSRRQGSPPPGVLKLPEWRQIARAMGLPPKTCAQHLRSQFVAASNSPGIVVQDAERAQKRCNAACRVDKSHVFSAYHYISACPCPAPNPTP